MTVVIIQARMSSRRLPGKVLQYINGTPILGHVAARCAGVVGPNQLVIATSYEKEDNPIAEFAQSHGFSCYRGPLENVYSRFAGLLSERKENHFIRVCADSPFLDPGLLETAIAQSRKYDVDLVTNVFPRSFPKGQSVEMIRTSVFLSPAFRALPGFSEEHVTQGFYLHSDKFSILNFSCSLDQKDNLETWAVDTPEDLVTIRDWAVDHPSGPEPFGVSDVTLHKAREINA
jgi:spore coat polysaccharide biosynthesis protein SpsF